MDPANQELSFQQHKERARERLRQRHANLRSATGEQQAVAVATSPSVAIHRRIAELDRRLTRIERAVSGIEDSLRKAGIIR